MAVVSDNTEISFSDPPAKVYKDFFLDSDNLILKLFSNNVKSVQILGGNGGPGTEKQITFSDDKSVKQRVDEMDQQNFVYKYSIIGGDALGELESVSFVAQLKPSGNGSVCEISSEFHNKVSANPQVKKEDVESDEKKIRPAFKTIDDHIHAN